MNPGIAILSGNHLCHNPRVIKEAAALSAAGYDVEVFGLWTDAGMRVRDQGLLANLPFAFTPALDLSANDSLRVRYRICRKLGSLVHQYVGFQNRWQLGAAAEPLLTAVRRSSASLFIGHSESAMWALSKLRVPKPSISRSASNFRLGVDLEDWFSEDLLPEARRQRPLVLLRGLEADLLRSGTYSSCPSQAMSSALAQEFECRPPAVIYNAFPWADRQNVDGVLKDRRNPAVASIHWYSQTIGPGRGLEELFAALPFLTRSCEVHLRGNPVAGFESWISGQVPAARRSRVFVHALVSNDELLSRIAEHDIGFAGEQKYCRNKDLTVSNKLLHYLLGGLAVVASDTAGQREIAAQAGDAVQLYPAGDAGALAQRLNRWLENPEHLADAKAAALRVAEQRFSWERQVPVLLRSVESALGAQPVMASHS